MLAPRVALTRQSRFRDARVHATVPVNSMHKHQHKSQESADMPADIQVLSCSHDGLKLGPNTSGVMRAPQTPLSSVRKVYRLTVTSRALLEHRWAHAVKVHSNLDICGHKLQCDVAQRVRNDSRRITVLLNVKVIQNLSYVNRCSAIYLLEQCGCLSLA